MDGDKNAPNQFHSTDAGRMNGRSREKQPVNGHSSGNLTSDPSSGSIIRGLVDNYWKLRLEMYLGEGIARAVRASNSPVTSPEPSRPAEKTSEKMRASRHLAQYFRDIRNGCHIVPADMPYCLATPYNRKAFSMMLKRVLDPLRQGKPSGSVPVSSCISLTEGVWKGFPASMLRCVAKTCILWELADIDAPHEVVAKAYCTPAASQNVNLQIFLDALTLYFRFPPFLFACGRLHRQVVKCLFPSVSAASDYVNSADTDTQRDAYEPSLKSTDKPVPPHKECTCNELKPSASVPDEEVAQIIMNMLGVSQTDSCSVANGEELNESQSARSECLEQNPASAGQDGAAECQDKTQETAASYGDTEAEGASRSGSKLHRAQPGGDADHGTEQLKVSAEHRQYVRIPCNLWLRVIEEVIYSQDCGCERMADLVIADRPSLTRVKSAFERFPSGECNIPEFFRALSKGLSDTNEPTVDELDHDCPCV